MKKYYCDLCGSETNKLSSISVYAGGIKILDVNEICDDCLNGFKKTIDDYKKNWSK